MFDISIGGYTPEVKGLCKPTESKYVKKVRYVFYYTHFIDNQKYKDATIYKDSTNRTFCLVCGYTIRSKHFHVHLASELHCLMEQLLQVKPQSKATLSLEI